MRGGWFGFGVFSFSSGDALNKTSLLTKWFAVSLSKLNHKHGREGKICPLYKPVSVHSFEGICIPAKLFDASAVECFRRKERGPLKKADKTAHLKVLEKFLPAESRRLEILALEQPCKPTVIYWTQPLVLFVKPSTVTLPLNWFASNTQGHCTCAAGSAQTHLFLCCFFQRSSSAVVLSNCRWVLLFPILEWINYVFKVTFGVPTICTYVALAGELTCDWIFLSAFSVKHCFSFAFSPQKSFFSSMQRAWKPPKEIFVFEMSGREGLVRRTILLSDTNSNSLSRNRHMK